MLSPEKRREILESYIPLMKFFAQQLPDTEIVLHDVSNLDQSIIAIENAHISGRTVGGSSTDLVLRILQEQSYRHQEFTPAYTSASATGRFLSSGTFFIKEGDELVGLLCTNTDLTHLQALKKATDDLVASRHIERASAPINEKLSQTVNDIPVICCIRFLSHNSAPWRSTGTRIGGHVSYMPPGAFPIL